MCGYFIAYRSCHAQYLLSIDDKRVSQRGSIDSIDTTTSAVSRRSLHAFVSLARKNESNNVFLKSKKECLLLLFSIFNVANENTRFAAVFVVGFCRISIFVACSDAHYLFIDFQTSFLRIIIKMASDRLVSVVFVFGINFFFAFSNALELECVFNASCLTLFRTFRSHHAIV